MIATRMSRSGEIVIDGPLEKVFALFTPIGELEWIPTWKYTPLYPAGGQTELDMVFRTDDGATTWTLARYEPPHTSVYILMNADIVARVHVECRAASAHQTAMKIAYIWTALSEKGIDLIAHQSGPEFEAKMARWKTWLDQYSEKAGWGH